MGESVFPAAESPSPIVPMLWAGVAGGGMGGGQEQSFRLYSQWALGGEGSGEQGATSLPHRGPDALQCLASLPNSITGIERDNTQAEGAG